MAMARSLLKSMSVPGKFWGEAVRHAVYLLNRLPTKTLEERIPFEAWTGRKSHLAHLRVFSCLTHVKVTTPYLKKLDDRSQGMVYLGVEEGNKAHRLYDSRKEKLYVSRDVKFEEQTGWCWDVGANAKEEPSFTVEGVFFLEQELEEAESEIESQFPMIAPIREPVPRTPTRAEVKIPSGPVTRVRARAAREAAATEQRLEISEHVTPTTTNLASLFDNSDEGPVRFKSVTDLLRGTSRLGPREEEVDGELFLLELDERSYRQGRNQSG